MLRIQKNKLIAENGHKFSGERKTKDDTRMKQKQEYQKINIEKKAIQLEILGF